jgi:hypothetical protein
LAQAMEAEAEAFLATMDDRLLPDGCATAWFDMVTAQSGWCRPALARSGCGG